MSHALPIAEQVADARAAVAEARAAGATVGLVPTMGALHRGHVELIRACRRDTDFVAVSIFVNPTQFGRVRTSAATPATWPPTSPPAPPPARPWSSPLPSNAMYPRGPVATAVEVPGLSDILEGASRPGHFRGVATVVLKLFEIIRPDLAHFGRKDYQQLAVIRRMVADLDVPVDVRAVETVREPDGLALSSRNRYLDADHRRAATVLSRALGEAARLVAAGERDAGRVRQALRDVVDSEPLAALDYAEVADAETLAPPSRSTPPPLRSPCWPPASARPA